MTRPAPPAALVHLALLTVSLLFGINFVGMKIVLDAVPATTWALVRVGVATLVLVPLTPLLTRGRPRLPGRRTLWLLLPAGILGVGGNQMLFALGLERTTASHSSILVACIPVLTLAFAAFAGHERVTRAKLASIALALSGALILLGVDRWFVAGSGAAMTSEQWLGDLLTLANVTSYTIFLVWMRTLGRHVDAAVSTAICFVWSTLFVAAITAPGLRLADLAPLLAPAILGWALFAILGATIATYLLNVWALRHAQSSQVALYIYVQPVCATALAIGMGQEAPDARFAVAATLVFAGLLASIHARRAERRAAALPRALTRPSAP